MAKVYFPNLNGLRFIAAFAVIIHHLEQYKYKFFPQEPNRWHVPFYEVVGKVAVVLFFVLSGFLITYLLLEEKRTTGTVAIRAFFGRRIRRIWPLYYLLVGLGLFVLPTLSAFYVPVFSTAVASDFALKLVLLLLIMPNLIVMPIPGIYQTWSIGVEEQFYLIWPVLFKKMGNPVLTCWVVMSVYLLVKFAVLPIIGYLTHEPTWMLTAVRIWNKFSVDCMAIGGLAAIALHRKQEQLLRGLFSKPVQVLAYSLSGILIAYGVTIPYVNFECYALLFAVIILNLAANPQSIIQLEFGIFRYLGKISYGLYMYHLVAIGLGHYLTQQFFPNSDFVFYGLSIALTIGLSAASYAWFESRFLQVKSRKIPPQSELSVETVHIVSPN